MFMVPKTELFVSQVQTGLEKGEKRMVGFINCTHLHAPEGRMLLHLSHRLRCCIELVNTFVSVYVCVFFSCF